jgi:hypothetical protein
VIVDALVSEEGSFAVPRTLATEPERSLDRYAPQAAGTSRAPTSLVERGGPPLDAFVARVRVAIAERHPIDSAIGAPEFGDVSRPDDPAPAGSAPVARVRVPIGWVDAYRAPDSVWCGGDVLAPRGAMRAAWPSNAPLDGARVHDMEALVRGALG